MKKLSIMKFSLSIAIAALLSTVSTPFISKAEYYEGDVYEVNGIDLTTKEYQKVSTTQEAIDILLKARSNHVQYTYINVDPAVVPIENENPGRGDLHSSIYNSFDYRYNDGLYNAMDYDVFSGPNVFGKFHDPQDPSRMNYCIMFDYHENDEELRAADNKLKTILNGYTGKSDAEKVISFFHWMEENVPETKNSDSGYPRNCSGIYGALFGDGTGYVCSTYALTIQRFCELAGIDSYIITSGNTGVYMSHAFNLVKVDGEWYAVDYALLRDNEYVLIGRDVYKNLEPYRSMIEKQVPASFKMAEISYGASEKEEEEKPTEEDSVSVQAVTVKRNNISQVIDTENPVAAMYEASASEETIEYSVNTILSSGEAYYTWGSDQTSELVQISTLEQGKARITLAKNETELSRMFNIYCYVFAGSDKGGPIITIKMPLKQLGTEAESSPDPEPENEEISVPEIKVKGVTNSAKRAITIKWKKDSSVKGYIVEYSEKKNFKKAVRLEIGKNKDQAKIKKLKKGATYFLHVRAYMTEGDTRVYGQWSETKKVKVTR